MHHNKWIIFTTLKKQNVKSYTKKKCNWFYKIQNKKYSKCPNNLVPELFNVILKECIG